MKSLMIALIAAAGIIVPSRPASPAADLAAAVQQQIPTGWKTEMRGSSVIATPKDVSEGKVFTVIVTPNEGKAGTLDDAYESAKQAIAKIGTYKEASEPKLGNSSGGWDYKVSVGTVEVAGKPIMAEIFGLKKGDSGGVIIVLSDSVATMQTYADAFSTMIRALGTSPSSGGEGKVDLQYNLPPGWTAGQASGLPTLVKFKNDEYIKYQLTLLVLPTETLQGSLRDSFIKHWNQLIAPNYTTSVTPLPLMERMSSGYAVAFDGDIRAKNKDGAYANANLYLISNGGKVVPVIGVFFGDFSDMDKELEGFFQTARIASAGESKTKLFDPADIAGVWHESSGSYADYVSAAGNFVGDASIMTSTSLSLNPGGSFKHHFAGVTSTSGISQDSTGKWSIEDNRLVLAGTKGTSWYALLGSGADAKVGRFLVIGHGSEAAAHLSFRNPRGPFQASWLAGK